MSHSEIVARNTIAVMAMTLNSVHGLAIQVCCKEIICNRFFRTLVWC